MGAKCGNLLVLFLCLSMAGCATSYVEPSDGDIATVVFENRTSGELSIIRYANSDNCGEMQLLGFASRGEREFRFRAGEVTTLGARYQGSTANGEESCLVMFSFMPTAGATYRFQQFPPTDRRCRNAFGRWDTKDKKLQKEETAVPRKFSGGFRAIRGCEGLTEAQKVTLGVSPKAAP